jgi:hypothetical protein
MPNLPIEPLTAIDVHVHIESDGHGHFSLDQQLMDASRGTRSACCALTSYFMTEFSLLHPIASAPLVSTASSAGLEIPVFS